MANGKFYIIENKVVTNIVVLEEGYALKQGFKRAPIKTDFGDVGLNWTYLPVEDTFLPPPRDILAEWAHVRNIRDSALRESDQYVLYDRWVTYNQDEQHAWSVYRQTLRDIPQSYVDPKEVNWPEKPWVESMESIKPSDPVDNVV